MRGLNRVEIIGNLTADPEDAANGKAARFIVATNRYFFSNGIKKEESTFVRCLAWDKLAELCKTLLHKGSHVYVNGRLNIHEEKAEIIVIDMINLKSGEGGDFSDDSGR